MPIKVTIQPRSLYAVAALSGHQLSIEKDGAVRYRDLVTILRPESMQYITKLATTQSKKTSVPPSPKIK